MRNVLTALCLIAVACATTKPVETKPATRTVQPVVAKPAPELKFQQMDVVGPKGTYHCECAEGSSGRLECYNCKCVDDEPATTPEQSSAEGEHWLTARIVPKLEPGEFTLTKDLQGELAEYQELLRWVNAPKSRKASFKGPPDEVVGHFYPNGPPEEGYHHYKKGPRHFICPLKHPPQCDKYALKDDEQCVDYSRCLRVFVDKHGQITRR